MYLTTIQFATPEYDEAVQLRTTVLREPLGLAFTVELLSAEYADTHIAAYSENGVLLGTLMLSHIDDNTVQMRQLAVHFDWQNKGIGKKVVAFSEAYARENKYEFMMLHARKEAMPFYEKLNYEVVGEEFEEVGIPHIEFRKNLKLKP